MGRKKIYLMFIVASMAVSMSIWGCGESKHSAEQGEDTTIKIAAAPGTADSMTAADMPLDIGSRLAFASNTPGKPVDVSFNLEGPWNFSSGPTAMTLNMAMVDPEAAFSAEEFPDATVAVLSSWSPGGSGQEYNFQNKDEAAWRAFGKSAEKSRTIIYSTPSRALVFPVSVGNRWLESYSEIEDGKALEITSENLVVARNTLILPAGDFDAFLLQTRVSAKRSGITNTTWDYTWFVPGIGRAAEIISEPNEPKETFTRARAFYRLKSYMIP